jgi:hypothetical protein
LQAAKKVSKNRLSPAEGTSCSIVLLVLFTLDLPTRALHIRTVYGAVTFGPGAALQRGGFSIMLHGLVNYSDPVTFKPEQETTALKIVVIT